MSHDTNVVYILEDRFNSCFPHWFLLVVSGLADLAHLPKPVKFHTTITEDFQRDTLVLLKPEFEFVQTLDGYTRKHHHGAPLKTQYSVEDHYYHFVRDQILIRNKLEISSKPFRRIYLRRSRAPALRNNSGVRRRVVHDEDQLVEILQKNGIECLFLEDFSLFDKIRLYQEASVIISPNSGALTCCYFARRDSQIIIITPPNPGEQQYISICKILSIPYVCYENLECIDNYGNLTTNFKMTVEYTLKLKDYDHLLHFIDQHTPK